MKKLGFAFMTLYLALNVSVVQAQSPLEDRVIVLETAVSDLQTQLSGAQNEIGSLRSELSNLLREDSVGNFQLQEKVILGDNDTSGELRIQHRNEASVFQVTSENVCVQCHAGEESGKVVIGNSDAPMDVDFAIKASSSSENALYFDNETKRLAIGSGVNLDGSNGNASQLISGNGFVKAWALIGRDGAFIDGYKSNGSRRTDEGGYIVDFNIGDLRRRPILATLYIGGEYIKVYHAIVSVNGKNTTEAIVITLDDSHNRRDIGRGDAVFVVVF